MGFEKCKNFNSVFDELNKMIDNFPVKAKKQGLGDKYLLVGIGSKGAEIITLLDRPVVAREYPEYEKLIIYKEMEVLK